MYGFSFLSTGSGPQLPVITCDAKQEENPLGIETGQPCFSWQIQAQQRNFEQSAWQILVADSPEKLQARQWKYLGQRKNAFFRLDPCSFQRKRIESRTDLLLESKELG